MSREREIETERERERERESEREREMLQRRKSRGGLTERQGSSLIAISARMARLATVTRRSYR